MSGRQGRQIVGVRRAGEGRQFAMQQTLVDSVQSLSSVPIPIRPGPSDESSPQAANEGPERIEISHVLTHP